MSFDRPADFEFRRPELPHGTSFPNTQSRVFVSNLPKLPIWELQDILMKLFSTHLYIEQVFVYTSKRSGVPFAFIYLDRRSTVGEAIEACHGYRIEGKKIKVQKYIQEKPTKFETCYQCGSRDHLIKNCPYLQEDTRISRIQPNHHSSSEIKASPSPQSRSPSVSRSRSRSVKQRLNSSVSVHSMSHSFSNQPSSHSSVTTGSSLSSSMVERIRSRPFTERIHTSLDVSFWSASASS